MRFIHNALVAVALTIGSPLLAQTDISLGGFSADPDAPVEIEADSLSIDQNSGQATFDGNVRIAQGSFRIAAGSVNVFYDETTSDISRIVANGAVTFVTQTDAAEAQNAVYDLTTGLLVLTGDVLLTQGKSAIASEKMTINLRTGDAQLDGRVRTTLIQSGN